MHADAGAWAVLSPTAHWLARVARPPMRIVFPAGVAGGGGSTPPSLPLGWRAPGMAWNAQSLPILCINASRGKF
jgi:hypothetical protein